MDDRQKNRDSQKHSILYENTNFQLGRAFRDFIHRMDRVVCPKQKAT
jgi:hypothetical protein